MSRLFKYTVRFRVKLGEHYNVMLDGMVQVRPDVWSEEHIAKMILKEIYHDDPRYYDVVLEQIPILG